MQSKGLNTHAAVLLAAWGLMQEERAERDPLL
jgi:hypothetical protein